MKKLWELLFSEASLVRQSYGWFFVSIVILPLIFLPTDILISFTYVLSCLAITVSAQTFVAGARANDRLLDIIENIKEVKDDVKEVKAENVETDTIETENIKIDKE